MHSTTMRVWSAAISFAVLTAMAPTAGAQWTATAIGVAEYDTEETLLLLAGLRATGPGTKIRPVLGIQGYHLQFDAGVGNTSVFTYRPYVGFSYGLTGAAASATLGYAFSDRDTPVASTTVGDQGDGVVLSGSYDRWGTGGPLGYQLLGSYNFGSESFWSRLRVTQRIRQSGTGQTRLGAEVAYLAGDGYSAVQPGGVAELHLGEGRILGVGAGMKFFSNGGGDAVYFKVEAVLPVIR
jgi:hypothetical protein